VLENTMKGLQSKSGGKYKCGACEVALAGEVNGEVKDLSYPLENDCTLNLLTFDDEGGRDAYRHTTSIYWHRPSRGCIRCKAGNRPAIENGFIMTLMWKSLFGGRSGKDRRGNEENHKRGLQA